MGTNLGFKTVYDAGGKLAGIYNYIGATGWTILAVGDSYEGGRVAYILDSEDPGYVEGETHGLIAATADYVDPTSGVPTLIYWHVDNTGVTKATAIALGTGNANTIAIVNFYGEETNAASVCYDYENDETGTGVYDDWFLPSKDELNLMYENLYLKGLGEFADGYYWSSSESSTATTAFIQLFSNGWQGYTSKKEAHWVRAVRAF